MREPMSESRRTVLAWLLPPVLALTAVGVQFLVDVPHHPMLVDQPDPPRKRTTTAARTTPNKYKPRGAEFSKRLRKQWAAEPIASEPIDSRFAEHHEELLRAITRKAEAAVTPDAEPIAITTATCHTIRCELEFCAAPTIADAIAETLPNFVHGRRSIWHELREVDNTTSDDERSCHSYVIDFAIEGLDPRKLAIGRQAGPQVGPSARPG